MFPQIICFYNSFEIECFNFLSKMETFYDSCDSFWLIFKNSVGVLLVCFLKAR